MSLWTLLEDLFSSVDSGEKTADQAMAELAPHKAEIEKVSDAEAAKTRELLSDSE